MKFPDKIPYLVVAGFAWIVIVSSCANQGMPTGGPRDTIPPILVGTYPDYKSLNFRGNEVRLTFNEFIIPDKVTEELVISPPLEKRPVVLTKSKTLVVRFNESLRDSLTYSLDFKNSVVDNNEGNPIENLRFKFSTGNKLDSLRVAGRVVNSFTMEPLANTLILLHRNLHDSAVYTVRPDYIARSDLDGLYLFDNLAEGKYHIFSLNDFNNNLRYDEGAEAIAFVDSLIVPSAEYHAEMDTLASGADSMLIAGHIHFMPGPVYLRQFSEQIFNQYLKTAKRNSPYQFTLVFNEPVSDEFNVGLVDSETEDWIVAEPNLKNDSITFWIADTTLTVRESIMIELSYLQVDSAGEFYVEKDTMDMQFAQKEDTKKRRRERGEDEDLPPPVQQFNWNTNLSATGFDLNKDVVITAPQPLTSFDSSAVTLYRTDDTLKIPLSFRFAKDTSAWRTYLIAYPWAEETSYTLHIDSAASLNIYGITSKELTSTFITRTKDYYGTINLAVTGVDSQMIVQLTQNNDAEAVIREQIITENQTVVFSFLPPEKYRIKAIYDSNGNGKWDTGSFQEKYQPEQVVYINEVVKIRSNWDSNLSWDLTPDPGFTKNIRDLELEEQMRKEAEEKAARELERINQEGRQQQNDMYQPGENSPGTFQPGRR
jgi:hypothetical protein